MHIYETIQCGFNLAVANLVSCYEFVTINKCKEIHK